MWLSLYFQVQDSHTTRKINIILTEGYKSLAGNTYFQGIRMSYRIVVSYQLGKKIKKKITELETKKEMKSSLIFN